MATIRNKMNHEELINGLYALLEESKVAKAKISYSNATERLQRKVKDLEERVTVMEEIFRKHNIIE